VRVDRRQWTSVHFGVVDGDDVFDPPRAALEHHDDVFGITGDRNSGLAYRATVQTLKCKSHLTLLSERAM
jgi:hypothetical protein